MSKKKVAAIIDAYGCGNKSFVIKWRLTDKCNFRCSYCLRSFYQEKREFTVKEKTLCKTAEEITKMLNNIDHIKEAKINLIGGEPSILNLEKILSHLIKNNTKVNRMNLTTNLSKPAKYYISLYNYLKKNNIILTITASYHNEFMKMNDYFRKLDEIIDKTNKKHISCEIVSTDDNQDLIKIFYKKCNDGNYDYKIEKDVRDKLNDKIFYASTKTHDVFYYKYDKKNKTIDWSKEPKEGYELCDGRYLIIYERAKPEVVKTRNELFQRKDIDILVRPNFVKSMGYYCTACYSFMDIREDSVISCRFGGNNTYDVSKFKLLDDINKAQCVMDEDGRCSICGSLSISKYPSLIK